VDLFGAALTEQGSLLPGHLRAALDAALLRTVAPHTPPDELAVRLAVLELVRILAAQSPVLMVIDDLQWVDEPSAGVLHFVARRLAGLPVQVLSAERAETGPVPAQLCPSPSAGVALTVLAAAARPTVELLERCGIDAGADLAEAVAAGLVTGGTDGSLAFSHPMLREMLYADADPGNRHAAHERLAAALDDPVERARHLAVIRPDPNEALASTPVDAAAVARRRGAPVVAAHLARPAPQRTPDPARAADRCLAAARHAFVGGLT